MTEQKTKERPKAETATPEKKGFFTRLMSKCDKAMKKKADKKVQEVGGNGR